QFARGLEAVWSLIGAADRYLAEQKPWALAELPDPAPLDAVLLAPVLPESAAKLWKQLGLPGGPEIGFEKLAWDAFPPGHRIGKPEALFPRMDKEKTVDQLRQIEQAPEAPAGTAPPGTPADTRISIDDFAKVELRVGEVVTAEPIKGADRLLKLTVDIGSEIRQIVAGIALAYDPASLPGRKVVIVANLAPRKLRGLESNGMIVAAAVGEAGTPVLVSVPSDTPNGARLR
ncbi:MAG: methionine--tRNA ligase subunit beta, partial [Terriglobales bacterium]